MDSVIQAIYDWIKEILVAGVMDNLTCMNSLKAEQPIEITVENKKDEAEKKGEDPAQDGKQDEKEKPSKRKSVKKQIAEKKDKTPRTKKPKEVDTKKLGEAI